MMYNSESTARVPARVPAVPTVCVPRLFQLAAHLAHDRGRSSSHTVIQPRPQSRLAAAAAGADTAGTVTPAYAALVEQTHATEIFDLGAPCVARYSQAKLDCDGYYCWDGLLTPAGTAAVKAACRRVQQLQDDEWVDARWNSVDWQSLGLEPPERYLSEDERAAIRGGNQLGGAPPGVPAISHQLPKRVPILDGYPPESFPAGYDGGMMGLLTHPQMLELNKLMLGPRPLYDHHTMLSRKAGFVGQHFHTHPYMEDDAGFAATIPAQSLIRNLVYPDGFSAAGDGGLKVVAGGHFYRACRTFPNGDDAKLAEWLVGKVHAVTGEPLQITNVACPPGTVVSIHTHTPHGVAPRRAGHGTRWCVTFNFANAAADVPRSPERNTYALPAEWSARAMAGQIPGVPAGDNIFSLH